MNIRNSGHNNNCSLNIMKEIRLLWLAWNNNFGKKKAHWFEEVCRSCIFLLIIILVDYYECNLNHGMQVSLLFYIIYCTNETMCMQNLICIHLYHRIIVRIPVQRDGSCFYKLTDDWNQVLMLRTRQKVFWQLKSAFNGKYWNPQYWWAK